MKKLSFTPILLTSMSGMTISMLRRELGTMQNIIANAKEDRSEYNKATIRLKEIRGTLDGIESRIKKIAAMPSWIPMASEMGFSPGQIPCAPAIESIKHSVLQTQATNQYDFATLGNWYQVLKTYSDEAKISEAQKRIKGIEERAEF